MGLMSRMLGRDDVRKVDAFLLPGGRDVEVKGEAQYQAALSAICGGRCPDGYQKRVTAALLPEPDNSYDEHAVQVFVENRLVGYINREDAADYSPVLQTMLRKIKATGACDALIVGGWDRGGGDTGHFGMWLNLASAETIARL
jgi:hypothetical protein